MYRSILPLSLAVCLFLSLVPLGADEKDPLQPALVLQEAMQRAIQQAEPSIACILVSRSEAHRKMGGSPSPDEPSKPEAPGRVPPLPFPVRPRPDDSLVPDLADPATVPESYGSGVVIDPKGLILTNYHVVRNAAKVYVRLPGGLGSEAAIHAADPRSDLAVLRLFGSNRSLPALKLGDGGKVRKGQLVLSIANPFAAGFRDGSPSASWGIISNIRRRAPGSPKEEEWTKTLHHYGTLLQTDARLNLGCSGGALINLQGELIGLTTSLAAVSGSETPGGFAVPLDAGMKRVIGKLQEGVEVEYGFLGVRPYPDPRGAGVQIERVSEGTPAAGKLKGGDSILAINGTVIHDIDDLFLTVGTCLAGAEVRLDVRSSDGLTRTVPVKLAKFYVPGKIIATVKPGAVRGLRVDYTSVLLQSSPPFLRPQGIPNGVMVREIERGSTAEKALLKVNDVITHVNNRPVSTPDDFYREAKKQVGPLQLTLEQSRLIELH